MDLRRKPPSSPPGAGDVDATAGGPVSPATAAGARTARTDPGLADDRGSGALSTTPPPTPPSPSTPEGGVAEGGVGVPRPAGDRRPGAAASMPVEREFVG